MAKVTKVTKIILASSLILSLSSMATAAEHHRKDRRDARPQAENYDINGLKVIVGAGVGTGIGASSGNGGVTIKPFGGLNAKLKLGTGIFTTTKNSTLGLQATIGVGANNLTAGFNTPQYSVNLDFMQAFKLGQSGYVKLGYIVGVGAAIRTNDNVNSGNGSFMNSSSAASSAVLAGATGVGSLLSGANLAGIDPVLSANLTSQLDAIQKIQTSLQNISNDAIAGQTQVGDVRSVMSTGLQNITDLYNGIRTNNSNFRDGGNANNDKTRSGAYGQGFAIVGSISSLLNGNTNSNLSTTTLNQTATNLLTAFNQTSGGTSNSLEDGIKALQSALRTVTPTTIEAQNPAYIQASTQLSSSLNALTDPNTGAIAKLQSAIQTNKANVEKYNIEIGKTQKNLSEALNTASWDAVNNLNSMYKVASSLRSTILNGIRTDAAGHTQNDITIDLDKNALLTSSFDSTTAKVTTEDPKTSIDAVANAVAEVKAAMDKVSKDVQNLAVIRAAISAQNSASQASLNAATKDAAAKRNNAVTILPTAKAGIVAFFGKHQSVSVEYQYYFRNTNPNFTSGEVTLNYAYYFGGK
ncbi:hypothetical protein [Helicobacter sp. 11S02629-2]|uniref:hypothetical protein n=1 Tax=Helicobacter sp. 11S02629-2 TaxID=1476195 RepID=UPI000BA6C84C|nr:hypothetical protein [Helicobacter sp. 11S02629-2]PAF41551.1 hypothetical protein BKH40_08390 [Helicobacter sp. 11S02629-2]